MDELIDHFQVTRQTVLRDIEEINENFSSAHISERNGIYRIKFLNDSTLQTLYTDVLNSDAAFQLFEVIFYDEDLSVENVGSKIFISTSATYKMIERIREPLEEYFNLDISTRPVHLVGEECDVRAFYNHYFSEKYNHFNLHMDIPIDEADFDEFLELAAEIVDLDIPFTYKYFFRISTGVNLIRFLQGHYLKGSFKDLSAQISELKSHEDFYEKLKEIFPFELDDCAIYQIIGQFAFDDYFFTYDEYEQTAQKNELIRFSELILQDTVETIEKEYHLVCPNAKELFWLMHNTGSQAQMDYLAIPLLNNRKEKFCEEVKKIHPELFDYIKQRMQIFSRVMNAPSSDDVLRHLIFTFYSVWENLMIDIQRLKPNVNILVVSQYDAYHAKLIGDTLKAHFGNRVNIQVYSSNSLKVSHLLEMDYDFIVNNFLIEGLDERPMVLINDYPTAEDFTRIDRCYNQCVEEKE